MANDPTTEALREFLRHVQATGRVRLELDVPVELAGEPTEPRLELPEGAALDQQSHDPVLVRVSSSENSTVWVAEANWTEKGQLEIGRVRRAGSDASTLQHSRSSYRVAVPPSSVASMRRIETDESVSVEPVDISRGGMGLRVDGDLSLGAGEEVEISLNIAGEFSDTLPGRVAFARRDHQRDQLRIGVSFLELDPKLDEALRTALNKILLGTTQEIT